MPSLAHRTIQRARATHEPSLPVIRANSTGEIITRATVTALAQVAMALGSWLTARSPAAPAAERTATRSGPSASTTTTSCSSPTARESGTWTTPSISGASR